jgi:hypothetical protein
MQFKNTILNQLQKRLGRQMALISNQGITPLSTLADKEPALAASQPASINNRRLIGVLCRETYKETFEQFPIASVSELKKVLQQRDAGKLAYHFIYPLKQGKRDVLTILPTKDVHQYVEQCQLIFPISLLVAAELENEIAAVETPEGVHFVLKKPTGDWSSVTSGILPSSVEQALLMLGGHQETKKRQIRIPELTKILTDGLRHIPLNFWGSGFYKKTRQPVNWQAYAVSAITVLIVYSLVSLSYINYQLSARTASYQAFGEGLEQVLQQRQQQQDALALLQQINSQQSPVGGSQVVWSLFAQAEQSGVTLTSVQTAFASATLQGYCESATEFLQLLLQQPYVGDASFSAPVRRDSNNREQFSIAVTLLPGFFAEQAGGSLSAGESE